MHMRGHRKFGLQLAACFMCLLALLHPFALADTGRFLDPTRTTSLTIQYAHDTSIPDAITFRLYYVATVDMEAAFTPVAPFDQYSISFRNDLSSSEWQALADTLTSYVEADQLPATHIRETRKRTATFADLPTGLYLVIGQNVGTVDTIFAPQPTLIVLPNRQSNGWWEYDVKMSPKWDIHPAEFKDLEVLKVWEDNDVDDRPTSVEVELYCDGALHDAILLTKENNWRHTWTGLDTRYAWTVVERRVPSGYTVTITEEEGVTVITNVRTYPPDRPNDPDIPKTGTDWTPVTALAGAGIILFCIGWLMQRKEKEERA